MDPRRALIRIAISTACGAASFAMAAGRVPATAAALIGWDVGAIASLALSWGTVVNADARRTRARAGAEDPGRTLVYALVVLASTVSFMAATVLVRTVRQLPPALSRAVALLCLCAVALAWALTHTAFAFRYAHLYYREDAEGVGGVTFPGEQLPAYFDFAYFSFTIGMCFQVSDVCVTSPQIRRAVLLHAIISFTYNSAILAFVLNLVFGLAS
jgi:uncharacterized membrane protein